MTKLNFLIALNEKLSGLPREEAEERLRFYSEMIEDRMEEGLSEEDAVAAVGSIDDIAAQILADVPLVRIAKEKIKPKRRMKAWEIVLLAVGSPVWFPLLLAAIIVVLSVYITLWAVVISLWAAFGALIGSGIGGTAAGVAYLCLGHNVLGIALTGAALVCLGLGIFSFYGALAATKGCVALAKVCILGIKKRLAKKEVAS